MIFTNLNWCDATNWRYGSHWRIGWIASIDVDRSFGVFVAAACTWCVELQPEATRLKHLRVFNVDLICCAGTTTFLELNHATNEREHPNKNGDKINDQSSDNWKLVQQ